MIAIINYGTGNSSSIQNMLFFLEQEDVRIVTKPEELLGATLIILPGVGSFDNGINKLKKNGFLEILNRLVLDEKVPFLGICLGMQLLFSKSEEGKEEGFGWIDGQIRKFDFGSDNLDKEFKIPHMGWNEVFVKNSSFMSEIKNQQRFYFVHSYYAEVKNNSDIMAVSNYRDEFTCAVNNKNIYGVQFHPEKSHKFGMEFFKLFLNEIKKC